MSPNMFLDSTEKIVIFKPNVTSVKGCLVPPHSFLFSTQSLAVAENKIFHMVTLVLHEIWKIKGKITSISKGGNWLLPPNKS